MMVCTDSVIQAHGELEKGRSLAVRQGGLDPESGSWALSMNLASEGHTHSWRQELPVGT